MRGLNIIEDKVYQFLALCFIYKCKQIIRKDICAIILQMLFL